MAAAVPRARILDLVKAQCKLFAHTFNPTRARTGNKILRQRLKGPILAAYYPRRAATIKDLAAGFKHTGLEVIDEDEAERLEDIQVRRARGKGAPKKKREKVVSKRRRK